MKSVKWILVRLGIAMSVFAFVALMVVVVLPAVVPIANLPFVQSIVQVAFCKPGEKLSTTYSTYDTPGRSTTSADMQCVNSDGQGREINDDFFKFVFIGYLVTFLGGFVLIGIG